jgi:hypothetical protein
MIKKKWTATEMGKVGGKKRAENLQVERRKEIATKAGKARTDRMTEQERKELSAKALQARWGKEKAAKKAAPKKGKKP